MNKLKFVIVLLILLLPKLGIAAGSGEEEAVEMGDIVVTGTRTKRNITEVPATINVVGKNEIEQSKGWNLGEVLESLPGVQSQTKNGGYDTHIIIRGAGAKAAYGVRDIMIMVDGVPITDPDSFTRLDLVDPSLIERIEVLKGPNSTLYGANAAGGVINIITKDSSTSQGAKIKASTGAFNSQSLNLSYGGQAGEKLSYFINGSHRTSDSWREHNKFDTSQLNAKFDYFPNDSSSLNLLLSYTQANMQLPGSLTKDEFESNPRQVSSSWQHSARDSETARFTLGYEKGLTGGKEIKGQLYLQNWKHYHPVPGGGINDGGSNVFGGELQTNIPHNIGSSKNLLTIGLSGQRDDRDSKKYAYRDWNGMPPYTSSDNTGELMEESGNRVYKWGIYLQESLKPFNGLLVDLGVRYDEVKFDIAEQTYLDWQYNYVKPPGSSYYAYATNKSAIYLEKRWNRVNPRIGINYALCKSLNWYGTAGTGFQTPTQGEIGTNPSLKPQKAINYETGLKGRFKGNHSFDLAFFHTSIDEEIIKLMDEDGVSYYDNAGKTLHKGVELSGRVQLFTGLYLGGSYAYSDFTFKEFDEMKREKVGKTSVTRTYSRNGNRIPLIPQDQYSLFLDYRHSSGANARIGSCTWEKYFVDNANSQTYSGFTVVNARIGYDWENLSLAFRVDNIFDWQYAAEVTESYGNISYTPGAPRTWTTSMSYKF